MMSLLKRVLDELHIQINYHLDIPDKDNLINLLNSLTIEEKSFIGKQFCEFDWSIGSIRVLSILQECQMLSATEYIMRQDNDEHIKHVLYDFLEFQYSLLANLLENFYYSPRNSMKLKIYLEDCFRNLIRDAIEKPEIVNIQYFKELRKLVSEKVYLKMIHMHLYALMKVENTTKTECFINSKYWIESMKNNKILVKLIEELTQNQSFALDEIFKISSAQNFKGWKYFLMILKIISQNFSTDSALFIKKYLKDLFKSFVSKCDRELCLLMFVIARTVYSSKSNDMITINNSNIETYSSWYKNTIGSMRYNIDVQGFKYVMSVLEEIIGMEDDPGYLQIHINTAINPPTHCNDIVLNYKKLCKEHLSSLTTAQKQNTEENIIESILIDDDDDDDV